MLYAKLGDDDPSQAAGEAIATDYLPLQWTPGLAHRYVACPIESAAAFRATYERPDVGFALLHQTHTAPEVWQYLAASGGGSSRLLAETGHYRLYQKRNDR